MKTTLLTVAVCGLVLSCLAPAYGGLYTFKPNPKDLSDLDHSYAYTWGFKWNIPAGQEITGANIFIDNINDWQVESDDILYVHLLDNPANGVKTYTDSENPSDYFKNQGLLLTTFTDDDKAPNPAEDWTYQFTSSQIATLVSYLANGSVGFGFDPDCHYYNDGVTFSIQTRTNVPEPSSLLMAAMSMGATGLLRRKGR